MERHGSPLYVYDLDEVERRADALRSMLPAGSKLFYALKANPIRDICVVLRDEGCGIEVASTSELLIALESGVEPSDILYAGPAKTDASNREALDEGVTSFSCDSWTDLERLAVSAETLGKTATALLRVNVSDAGASRVDVAAMPRHFGVDEQTLVDEASRRLEGLVDLAGIHVYTGTQIPGVEALARTFEYAIDIAERIAGQGLPLRILDLGGGFPWPFATSDAGADLSGLEAALHRVAGRRARTAAAELWFESGRYLAASCGTLVARVLDVKQSPDGRKCVILDSGMNHLGGTSGFGRDRAVASITALAASPSDELETVDVMGPIDSPLDCIARETRVGPLRPGDAVAVPNVGAYGLTASLVGFAGRRPPAEVCCRGTEEVSAFRLRIGHERIATPALTT